MNLNIKIWSSSLIPGEGFHIDCNGIRWNTACQYPSTFSINKPESE